MISVTVWHCGLKVIVTWAAGPIEQRRRIPQFVFETSYTTSWPYLLIVLGAFDFLRDDGYRQKCFHPC